MTITEKILARASGKQRLSPGDVMFARVDKVMLHDVSGPGVIKVFSEWEKKRGIKLIKSGILTGYGSRRIILSLPLIEFLQRILQHFPTLLDSMASINISLTVLVSMGSAIRFHMKRLWFSQVKCTLEGTRILNTTGALGARAAGLGHTDIAYTYERRDLVQGARNNALQD